MKTCLHCQFWPHVQRGEPDECWPWLSTVNQLGRPMLCFERKLLQAKRVSFWLARGSKPASDTWIGQKCANILCCNPSHLRIIAKNSLVGSDHKRCGKCRKVQSLTEFDRQERGYHSWCKGCRHDARLLNRRRDRASERRLRLLKTYGMTMHDYEARIQAQQGVCAICGNLPGEKGFGVDHDHVTGQVRALLCSRCNTGLAMFGDDTALLAAAVAYVEEWRAVASASTLSA